MADPIPPSPPRSQRIVLTTLGSLGDLHPYLAIARGLQARGHQVMLATSAGYRQKIEAEGIGFHPVRPDLPAPEQFPELIRRIMHRRKGSERIIRELVMPALADSYADLLAASAGADLILSHPLTFAARLVAEKTGIVWASSVLSPLSLFSTHDPSVLPVGGFLAKMRFLGPIPYRLLLALGRQMSRSWVKPWHRFRAELGLPPAADNPLFEGQHSPALVLALFSPHLAGPQPDWPRQTVTTGFPFGDVPAAPLPPILSRFLADGPPPIVFTLGSSAVMDAGAFYHHSADAARRLGRRAILLTGDDPANRPAALPPGIMAWDYAPFAALFSQAAAVVHQGGIGTSGEALRAGKPMLVMPYAHDQPDNAYRLVRLGVARAIARRQYRPDRVAGELGELLSRPAYAQRAGEVAGQIRQETGVQRACEAIERLLSVGASTSQESPVRSNGTHGLPRNATG